VHLGGRPGAVQVFRQALELDAPQAEQGGGRDLRLRVIRAHRGPPGQDLGGHGDETEVVYRLEPHAGGTRFSYERTGFTGVGGVFMAKLLGHVRRKMLNVGLPAVLDDLNLRDSTPDR
jgi:hypothetical protein